MRFIKAIAASMCVAAILTSCSEDQSTFNINSIPGRGVIEGTVLYNQGTKFVDGKFVYDYQPAANLNMIAVVTNSEYDSNLSGETRFEITTDENGKYSLEIPAPAVNKVSVRLITSSFRGNRSVVKIENNNVVTVNEPVIYTGMSETSVRANGIEYCNFVCTETSVDRLSSGFLEYANVKGRLGQNIEKYTPGENIYDDENNIIGHSDATIEYLYTGTAKTDLIVNVDYNGSTFVYNTTTDASGNYSLQVPVSGFPASFECTIEAVPYNGKFTQYEPSYRLIENYYGEEIEYRDYEAHTLNGYYSQKFRSTHNLSFPVSSIVGDIEDKTMIFNLTNHNDDSFGYSSENWNPFQNWLE